MHPAMEVLGRPATTMEWRRLLLCLVVMYVLFGTVVAGGRPPATYVFGSSILDVGNNNYLPGPAVGRANYPHNGVDFPGSIPTGRWSNGYNLADYVAKNMGFAAGSPPAYLSLAPTMSSGGDPLVHAALTKGVSYASGGAGILDSTNAGNTIPFSKQVGYFAATKAKMVAAVGSHAVDALLARSVFVLAIGNNDMYAFAELLARNSSEADQRSDIAVFYANLISNYSATVTELYLMGARKLAIVNVWLVGCVPGVWALNPVGECSHTLNQLAAGFNDRLQSLLADLAPSGLRGLVYSLGDAFGFTADAMADPEKLGFMNVTGACCGSGQAPCLPSSTLCTNRDQYLFWDGGHMSQRTAFLMARAFYHGSANYTTPISFMQLAQCNVVKLAQYK